MSADNGHAPVGLGNFDRQNKKMNEDTQALG